MLWRLTGSLWYGGTPACSKHGEITNACKHRRRSGRPDQSKEHPWCQQMKLASMNSCLCLDLLLKPLVLLRLQLQAVMRTLWFRFPHSIQIWFNFTCSIQPVWWWYCISWTFKYTIYIKQDRTRSYCILGFKESQRNEQYEEILKWESPF